MFTRLTIVLVFLIAASGVYAEPIEERVIFSANFCKTHANYPKNPAITNFGKLQLTEDGLLFGEAHAAPEIKLDSTVWDGQAGAISFSITPENWGSDFDQTIVFLRTVLKNPKKNIGKDILLFRRAFKPNSYSLILEGDLGRNIKRRDGIFLLSPKQFRFKRKKTVNFILTWINGKELTLYINGKIAAKRQGFYFPAVKKIKKLIICQGSATRGFGIKGLTLLKNLSIIKGAISKKDINCIMNLNSNIVKKHKSSNSNPTVLPFPAVTSKPRIDGKIKPDEYAFSQDGFLYGSSGRLSSSPAALYTASDSKNIYIAMKLDTQNPNYSPQSRSTVNDDGLLVTGGDIACFVIRPDLNVDSPRYDCSYITISPNNALYDAAEQIDWSDNSCLRDSKVNFEIKHASSFKNGKWIVELLIPRKSLKIDSDKDFLISLGLKIANRQYHIKHHSIWFDNNDAFLRGKFLPACKINAQIGKIITEDFNSKVTFTNKSQKNISPKIELKLNKSHTKISHGEVVLDQVLNMTKKFISGQLLSQWQKEKSLLPKQELSITPQFKLATNGNYQFITSIKDSQHNVIYYRQVPFKKRKPFEVELHNNPIKNIASLDLQYVGIKPLPEDKINICIRNSDSRILIDKTFAPPKQKGVSSQTIQLDTTILPVGKYNIEVKLKNKSSNVSASVSCEFNKKPLPNWFKNPVGLEALERDYVPEPWTPVEVVSDTVSVWGRKFIFNSQGLADIKTQNISLFRAPLLLEAQIDNKIITIPLTLNTLKSKGKGVATAELAGNSKYLKAQLKFSIEFDGLAWVSMQITPASRQQKITRLSLKFALQNVPYYQTLYDYCSMDFGYLRNRKLVKRMHAVWLGNDSGGLNFLAENYRSLKLDSRRERLEIKKNSAGADFYIHLINTPVKFKKAIDWRFALHPTPTKKPYAGWQNERSFMMGYNVQPFNFIQLHTHQHAAGSTAPVPRNWAMAQSIANLGKINKQKIYPYTIPFFISKELSIKPYAPFRRNRLPDDYFYPVNSRPQVQEYIDFGEDWNFSPVSTYPGVGSRHNGMIACSPASSWTDYLVYSLAKYLKKTDMSGFYFDLTMTRENFDPKRNYNYTTLDGKVEGTRELYAARNLYKRLYYTFAKLRGKSKPYIWGHGYPIFTPMSSFWGVGVHGEQFKPKKMFDLSNYLFNRETSTNPTINKVKLPRQADYSGHLLRLQYSQKIWGVPQMHFSQYAHIRKLGRDPNSAREGLALMFLNNTLLDSSYLHFPSTAKFFNRVTIPYDMTDAKYHAYYENNIKVSSPMIKISYWSKPDCHNYLVAIANWGDKDLTATINLPKKLLDSAYVYDPETALIKNCWVKVSKNWNVRVRAHDLRVFRFIGKKIKFTQ
jgi:glycosyl hydrolase family 123